MAFSASAAPSWSFPSPNEDAVPEDDETGPEAAATAPPTGGDDAMADDEQNVSINILGDDLEDDIYNCLNTTGSNTILSGFQDELQVARTIYKHLDRAGKKISILGARLSEIYRQILYRLSLDRNAGLPYIDIEHHPSQRDESQSWEQLVLKIGPYTGSHQGEWLINKAFEGASADLAAHIKALLFGLNDIIDNINKVADTFIDEWPSCDEDDAEHGAWREICRDWNEDKERLKDDYEEVMKMKRNSADATECLVRSLTALNRGLADYRKCTNSMQARVPTAWQELAPERREAYIKKAIKTAVKDDDPSDMERDSYLQAWAEIFACSLCDLRAPLHKTFPMVIEIRNVLRHCIKELRPSREEGGSSESQEEEDEGLVQVDNPRIFKPLELRGSTGGMTDSDEEVEHSDAEVINGGDDDEQQGDVEMRVGDPEHRDNGGSVKEESGKEESEQEESEDENYEE